MPLIRSEVHRWYGECIDGKLDENEQVDLALSLFGQRYTEEKLAGVLLLHEILIPTGMVKYRRDLRRFGELFGRGKIDDWNICDWFCVKVLASLIGENGKAYAQSIAKWRDAKNLWKARASVVSFVKAAGTTDYYPLIAKCCRTLIRREERFAKTAVGWILRDISKHDETFVCQFIEENIECFSAESLGNATKYFSMEARTRYRRMREESSAS